MPRPARFHAEDILDAALSCVGEVGHRVTVADIAARLGAPVGSIYHRFSSREVLVVRLWLRSVERFQAGLFELAGAEAEPHQAMIEIALHIPRYCRAHPDEAASLTLFRQDRLLAECPEEVRPAVEGMNNDLLALQSEMTRRRYGRLTPRNQQWASMATRIAPYGLVRPYLGGSVPLQVDDAVAATTDAILRLGDVSER